MSIEKTTATFCFIATWLYILRSSAGPGPRPSLWLVLDDTGIGSPSGATCSREREFSKQTADLLLESGGRDARQPETTWVHQRQADGKGISLNRMRYLWDIFSGFSPRVFILCDLNLRDWIEVISRTWTSFLFLIYAHLFT